MSLPDPQPSMLSNAAVREDTSSVSSVLQLIRMVALIDIMGLHIKTIFSIFVNIGSEVPCLSNCWLCFKYNLITVKSPSYCVELLPVHNQYPFPIHTIKYTD